MLFVEGVAYFCLPRTRSTCCVEERYAYAPFLFCFCAGVGPDFLRVLVGSRRFLGDMQALFLCRFRACFYVATTSYCFSLYFFVLCPISFCVNVVGVFSSFPPPSPQVLMVAAVQRSFRFFRDILLGGEDG